MKKFVVLTSFAMLLALPTLSQAVPVCFTDSNGSFYRLEVKPACKANSSKIAALNGRIHWVDPNATCGGTSNVFAITGSCFGRPAQNKVVVGLQFIAEGPGCGSQIMHLAGPTINSVSGYVELVYNSGLGGAAISFTPAACNTEPAL